MQHLDKIDEVGSGIAVAFRGHDLRGGLRQSVFFQLRERSSSAFAKNKSCAEMILEGVASILEGMNPRMMETKLWLFRSRRE